MLKILRLITLSVNDLSNAFNQNKNDTVYSQFQDLINTTEGGDADECWLQLKKILTFDMNPVRRVIDDKLFKVYDAFDKGNYMVI